MKYNKIIESMLNNSLSNCILLKVKEGQLVEEDATIYVIYDNKKYFLTYAPYEDSEGNTISKRDRKSIANEFITNYKYNDIVNMYEEKQNEKKQKAIEAEENKKQLEELIEEYEDLKQYGEINILADNIAISYYIEFKRSYDYKLEIYPGINDIYNIKYNYEPKEINKEELAILINNMIQEIRKEIEKDNEDKKEELRQQKIFENKRKFAEEVTSGKVAIIKLKYSFQCLENGLRYTVGKGSGKFYSLRGVSNIIDYLDKKDIKQYCFVSAEEVEGINIKTLKGLKYKEF